MITRDRAKAVRAKLCHDHECKFDAGCGCLEAIEALMHEVRIETEASMLKLGAWLRSDGENARTTKEG